MGFVNFRLASCKNTLDKDLGQKGNPSCYSYSHRSNGVNGLQFISYNGGQHMSFHRENTISKGEKYLMKTE